jgi:hypothetical protein
VPYYAQIFIFILHGVVYKLKLTRFKSEIDISVDSDAGHSGSVSDLSSLPNSTYHVMILIKFTKLCVRVEGFIPQLPRMRRHRGSSVLPKRRAVRLLPRLDLRSCQRTVCMHTKREEDCRSEEQVICRWPLGFPLFLDIHITLIVFV